MELETKTREYNGKTYTTYVVGSMKPTGQGMKFNEVLELELSFDPKIKDWEKNGKRGTIVTVMAKPTPKPTNVATDTKYNNAEFMLPSGKGVLDVVRQAKKGDVLFLRIVQFDGKDDKGNSMKKSFWEASLNKKFEEKKEVPVPAPTTPPQSPSQALNTDVAKLKDFCKANAAKVVPMFGVESGQKPLAFITWVQSGKAGIKQKLDDGQAMAIYYEVIAPLISKEEESTEPSLD